MQMSHDPLVANPGKDEWDARMVSSCVVFMACGLFGLYFSQVIEDLLWCGIQ